MVFSSLLFMFVFLPATLLLYYVLPKVCRNVLLLLASLLFYAHGEPSFVYIMIASSLLNYCFGLLVSRFRDTRWQRRAVIITASVVNIGILVVFKYLDFLIEIINGIAAGEPLTPVGIALPIGISFFTFQAFSYVLDVAKQQAPVQKNPLNVMLYISLFPQLIAGPIVRYNTVAAQIACRHENMSEFAKGVKRFICGLGKKILLANTLGVLADYTFEVNEFSTLPVLMAWLGAVAYAFQILFDFSGYSDMAIGLGLMFGFHFEENFRYPYACTCVSDFWRRWHISLGTWFRDYVYFPMGGSRVNKGKLIRNLFVVWCLTGIWHGANWTFVLWGLLYFGLLTFEKLTGIPKRIRNTFLRFAYRVFSILSIGFGWILFRCKDIVHVKNYLATMLGRRGNLVFDDITVRYARENAWFFVIAVIASFPIVASLQTRAEQSQTGRKILAVVVPVFYLCVLLLSVSYLVTGAHNPFIYFNF